MATFSAECANVLAARLQQSSPYLLNAARTFPSVATSPYYVVRYGGVALPLFFSLITIVTTTRRAERRDWTGLLRGLFFWTAYVLLALEVRKLTAVAAQSYTYRGVLSE